MDDPIVTSLTIDPTTPTVVTNPLLRSCHLDEGYVHASWSLYSQMIMGASFDNQNIWNMYEDSVSTTVTYTIDPHTLYYNFSTMQITVDNKGTTDNNESAGLTNRGMGNEGLVFYANQEYEGYVIATSSSASSVTLIVGLRDTATNYTLASTLLTLPGNNNNEGWTNLSFTLVPNASTVCIGIEPGSVRSINCGDTWPSPGHICVQCNGEFFMGIVPSPGTKNTVNIAYTYLQPGTWGRFANLPVKREGITNLQSMGIQGIRVGGTYAQGIYWKDWRGNVAQRPSRNFFAGEGNLLTFGMFDILDIGPALDIELIITMSRNHSVQDMIDLVDYCYGNASLPWGSVRIYNDSHPAVYRLTGIELGNEDSNDNFVAQITAMEQRAQELNLVPSPFYYLYPENTLPYGDIVSLNSSGFPAEKVMGDCHGGWGGQLDSIVQDFHSAGTYNISGINCETNGLYNGFGRALEEAIDIILFDNAVPDIYNRIIARMVSFCNERSGHMTRYDQGASFWLPNMTWLQPPGWIHAMNSIGTGKEMLNVQPPSPVPSFKDPLTGEPPFPSLVSYSASGSPGVVYLHIVNTVNTSTLVNVTIPTMNINNARGSLLTSGSSTNFTIMFNATNTPAEPFAVSPVPLSVSIIPRGTNGSSSSSSSAVFSVSEFLLPPYSYAVVNFTES